MIQNLRLTLFKLHINLTNNRDIIYYISLMLHWTGYLTGCLHISEVASILEYIATNIF